LWKKIPLGKSALAGHYETHALPHVGARLQATSQFGSKFDFKPGATR
jgi:hypothetical protein